MTKYEKNMKTPFLKGTKVISKGDTWITPGSVGEVVGNHAGPGTVLVKWHIVQPESNGKTNTRRCNPNGKNLYHLSNTLIYDDGAINPNFLFKMKKRG